MENTENEAKNDKKKKEKKSQGVKLHATRGPRYFPEESKD